MAHKGKKDAQLNAAAKSLDYQALKWDLVTAVLGGTRAMREKGADLPQHIEEEDDAYDLRVTSTVLLNAFEEAVDGVVSRVFAEVILTEEAHDEFVEAADQRLGTDQAAVGDDAHPRNGEAPAGWGMK